MRWLQDRADNVAAGILAVMFLSFMLQIVSRYVFNAPIGWTLELCLVTWLWLVFWTSAFCLRDSDHIRFDMIYLACSPRVRRIFALVSAVAIVAGIAAALPATFDYITFYKIKKSTMLRIRLDVVFSVYGIFAVAVIARYALRAWQIARGADPDAGGASPNTAEEIIIQ
jgi:TRAP-type C4-dicarboxylate transport system permease small subunit